MAQRKEYENHPAANAFPMMDDERFEDLREDIRINGQREPITICDDKILDGRNRFKACVELGREPVVRPYEGDPWSFVWSLNGERRDLNAEQRYLIWKECTGNSEAWQAERQRIMDEANQKRSKAAEGNDNAAKKRSAKNSTTTKCCNTESDNHRKGQQAKATASKTNAGAVARGDKLAKERPDLADAVRKGEMKPAEAHREMKRAKVIAELTDTKAIEAKAIEGIYDVIVIDPPWPMKKIERDVTPEQVEFEYPTMTIDELEHLEIPCADDCHVWLWTTQKFLPNALDLLFAWNLKYVCTFVWHKNGGFQPFGLPQYNCEFVIYARRGAPQFIDTKAFPTCFEAARGKHSEKPQVFYDMVARVTAGRRLDMFNRRKIDGFDAWGKEAVND